MLREVFAVWAAMLRHLRSAWRPMLAVNLLYVALGIVLLAPLPGILAHLLIRLSGAEVLADQDIAYFLLTPFGMASLILVAAVLVAIGALAQASLMFVVAGVESGVGRERPAFDALRFAAGRVVRILDFALRLVVRLLLLMAPFLAIAAATAWLLITDHDINYYLSMRPPAFWIAGMIIGILLLMMSALVVRRLLAWSLALPLVLFADISPAQSFAESERLTRNRRSLVLGVLAVWGVIAVLLGTAVVAVLQWLGALIVPRFFDALTLLVIVLGGLVALWAVLSILVGAFNGTTFALALVELAKRLDAPIRLSAVSVDLPVKTHSLRALGVGQVAALLVGVALVAVLTGVWLVRGIEVSDSVTIAAHRGAAGKAPENTLAAMRQAIEDRTDWIEIDVQESADGEVVVFHDSDFMKLAGVPLKVWDATLEEIRAIDIGSWFGLQFAGERVPTLREVLELARGKVRVVIELKYYGHDHRLEERVAEIVESTGMVSDVAIMSLNYEAVQTMRALRPDWRIGLLSATAIGDLTRLDADFLAVNMEMASAGFVRHARAAGKQVFVWTPNEPVAMSRMVSVGVDGLITDEPEMAREVVEVRERMSPAERLLVHAAELFGQPVPERVYRDDSP
jgi:glycerophosphoryl diester phosphodiesterase